MPRFSYTAIDHRRKTVKGNVTAENAYTARKNLRAKGLHPTSLKEFQFDTQSKKVLSFFKKNATAAVTEYTRQTATMLGAGIKLTEALGVMAQQIRHPQLKDAVTDIRDRVVTGESFADALTEYDNFFDPIYISMMRVGEVTGTLESSLKSVADFMEKRQRMKSKMATAMIYPIILMVFSLGAALFLTATVIPMVAKQLEEAKQELPAITEALMAVSSTIRSWKILIVIAVIGIAIWLVKRFTSTERGAFMRDKVLLSLPVFGTLLKQRIVARFASTLSTLLESGLSMADSLKVVAGGTGNAIMSKAVKEARERILSGSDIATPLRDSGVIDPTIAHMVMVGERSGELEQMLKTISNNLEATSDVVIERLSALMEPIIIMFMALVVGVIAMGSLIPILDLSSGRF